MAPWSRVIMPVASAGTVWMVTVGLVADGMVFGSVVGTVDGTITRAVRPAAIGSSHDRPGRAGTDRCGGGLPGAVRPHLGANRQDQRQHPTSTRIPPPISNNGAKPGRT